MSWCACSFFDPHTLRLSLGAPLPTHGLAPVHKQGSPSFSNVVRLLTPPFTSHAYNDSHINHATMSESQKLLHEHQHSDSDSEPEPSPPHLSPGPSPASSRPSSTSPNPAIGRPNGHGYPKRQSSFAQPRPDGTPRTPHRVRFEDPVRSSANGDGRGGEWIELEGDDYLDSPGYSEGRERVQRLPLLTGIEAPSVTVATEDFNPEDLLESARPRSGMRSAFMNMANSIMCVHISICAGLSLPCVGESRS